MAILFLAVASATAAAPVITFENNSVIATGVTPGKATAWFAVSHEASRYPARVTRFVSMMTDEGNGMVRVDLPNEIHAESIWIVADVETGESSVAAPEAFKVKASTLPANALRRRATGVVPGLDLDADEVEVFYLRPRVGAWSTSAGRALDLRSMHAVGASPAPPDDFAADDVIVVVDAVAMTVRTLRVR